MIELEKENKDDFIVNNWRAQEELKIICHRLMMRDFISYSDWVVDVTYFSHQNSAEIKSGYYLWATPLLSLMKKSVLAESLVAYPAKWLIEDIKYKKGLRLKAHKRGFLLRHLVFNPCSWFLGSCFLIAKSKRQLGLR